MVEFAVRDSAGLAKIKQITPESNDPRPCGSWPGRRGLRPGCCTTGRCWNGPCWVDRRVDDERSGRGNGMPAFRSTVSVLLSFVGRTFSTDSRPALRAAPPAAVLGRRAPPAAIRRRPQSPGPRRAVSHRMPQFSSGTSCRTMAHMAGSQGGPRFVTTAGRADAWRRSDRPANIVISTRVDGRLCRLESRRPGAGCSVRICVRSSSGS